MRRRSRSAVVVLALTTAATAAAGGASAAPPPPPLPDGVWVGAMVAGAALEGGADGAALTASGRGSGTFTFDLAAGLPTGTYRFDGTSESQLSSDGATGTANGVAVIDGTVEGTSEAPILQPSGARVDVAGAVVVSGLEVPFDVTLDLSPEELTASTLVVTSSSCTFASGRWAQELRAAIESAGLTVTRFEGSWAAQLAPGSSDAAELTGLLQRGEALLEAYTAGAGLDDEALGELLRDADLHAAAARRSESCADLPLGDWASPLAGLVDRVLRALVASPDTSITTLRAGIGAGLRSGVLPEELPDLEIQLEAVAQQRLQAAIEAGDTVTMVLVEVVADMMGWTDLGQQAAVAFGAAG